jgi:outer membrane receptor protein involved in Fe transport
MLRTRKGGAAGVLALLLAIAIDAPASAAAQVLVTLDGTVRSGATGEGVANVSVQIEETGQGATTGADGAFRIRHVRPGRYTLVASALAFQAARRAIEVSGSGLSAVVIELTPQPIELNEVLARADRSYSAASSRVAREFDIVVRPARSSQDLLQLAPGLLTAQHAGGGKAEQIFLRGFDADHGTDVAITVDGLPVNMVSHGHGQGYADLHFLIPDVVERIDVFKGPYQAASGNFATAGTVAFSTRDHLDDNLVRTEVGAFGTASVTALYQVPTAGPHQGAYLASQFYRTDGPFDAPQDFGRFNLFGRFHTHLADDARLALTASGFSSAWDASGQVPARSVGDGLIGRFGAIDDLEGGTTGRQDVNLLFETGTVDEGFRLQGYFTRYDFKLFSNFTFFLADRERGDMIEQTDQREIHGLNGRYRFAHGAGPVGAVATLGGGFRGDDVDVTLWRSPGRARLDQLVDSRIVERNLYLWGEDELFLAPRLRLQLGLRWDYFTFNVDDRLDGAGAPLPHASGYEHQSILSPKANLVFSPMPSLDVFANTGLGFHSNDARGIVIDRRVADLVRRYRRDGVADADIDERLAAQKFDPGHRFAETLPRALGAELGVRARPVGAVNVAAAAWLIDLEREFVFVGDGGFTELSGRSRRYGLDLEARAAINAWLSIDSDLSLSRGMLRDEPRGADRIPLAPRLTWTGGLSALRPDRIDATLRFVHVDDRPANEDASVIARGYTVFNLLGGYRRGRVRLNGTLENVFDAEWNEAQFDTESRLRDEAAPVSELHFTPGNPRNLRVGVSVFF